MKYSIEDTTLKAIADKIREYNLADEQNFVKYTTSQMPTKIGVACQNEYNRGYNNGFDNGKDDALASMLPLEIQSQYKGQTYIGNDGGRAFLKTVFETDYSSFDDFADYGSTVSSNIVIVTAENYTNFYAHFYFLIDEEDEVGETRTAEVIIVCPPNTDRSAEYALFFDPERATHEVILIGVRFSIYE